MVQHLLDDGTICSRADNNIAIFNRLSILYIYQIGPLVWVYKDWEDDPALSGFAFDTNDYLLPILYNSDYETVAHAILDDFSQRRRGRSVGMRQ